MITSRSNIQLKKIRKLLNSAKERKETGLFVIEGMRLVKEAPDDMIDSVYIADGLKADTSGFKNTETVDKEIFAGISDTVTPQGILAVVRQPKWEPSYSGNGKVLLLDGIRDPGNMGTIIRTAEAAGADAVFMSPDCVDLYNPKVIRSTMGSIFRVPVISADLISVIGRLKSAGRPVYGTSLTAAKSYRDAELSAAAIVIGSEANGISPAVAAAVDENLLIPMAGQVESLNAAVSAAIMMFC